MSYVRLSKTMVAMLHRVEHYKRPLTLMEMAQRVPTEEDRKELFRLWLEDLLRVAPGPGEDYATISRPFRYELTEEGERKLQKIREGEATDRYEAAIERVRDDNPGAEVRVVPDRGQSKRSLAIVIRDGRADIEASRWIYSTGTFRTVKSIEIEGALES